jgi:hypothetical protein
MDLFWTCRPPAVARGALALLRAGVKYPCYQRIRRGESHFQMERFWAEDRHNPLPHIALSTTALKSAYSNTALPSTHTAAELRKVLIVGG